MDDKLFFLNARQVGCVLAATFLVTLTGCIGYVERPRPDNVYYAPREAPPVIIVQDDYVYYPAYEVYYSSSRHQYAYRDGSAWVSHPAPRGVTVEVLFASPSVRLPFHDSPEHHHAAVIQQYPRNWSPAPHLDKGQQDDQGEKHRGKKQK